MAPNLAASQHVLSRDMLVGGRLKAWQIADAIPCSTRTVKSHRANLRRFGTTTTPRNRGGRQRSITPSMLEALLELLDEQSDLYLDELAEFLLVEYDCRISLPTISRTLKLSGWSKKIPRRRVGEQSQELRDAYRYNLSFLDSDQLVFVDESACDKRVGFRRTAWSPRGVTPVQVTRFHRGQRYQILPAYTQDGILLARVFQDATDSEIFEDFIQQLLNHCGRWPEPKSVLIMDNASFHRTDKIKQMCANAGVKLVYLPPYSCDLNPIEEFFAQLKARVRRKWRAWEANPEVDFEEFLEECLNEVGSDAVGARGHFRNAGVVIDERYCN
jgi:transposase